jgi:hypothetical protein
MEFDLDKILNKVSAIKLPGGVVGKVCIVLVIASICIGVLAGISKNEWILGAGIAAIFLLAFPMLWRLISFADRNPQAALLEGAEFLLHTQMVMGSKNNPIIPLEAETITEERPAHLPAEERLQLDEPEEQEGPTSSLTARHEEKS